MVLSVSVMCFAPYLTAQEGGSLGSGQGQEEGGLVQQREEW
jgi:hypothetical protein